MIGRFFLLLFIGSTFFFSSESVHAVGGVSMTMEPGQVDVGKTATVYVDVDPGGASLNIVQVQVRYDPNVWDVRSCTADESFKGIAGQSACVVDNAGGGVQLQMETRSARGPKQKTRVATISLTRKGSGSDTLGIPPGQIVVQDDSGQSSLLTMPDVVRASGSRENIRTVLSDPEDGESKGEMMPEPLVPPSPEEPKGFFQSIAAWFSQLFGF